MNHQEVLECREGAKLYQALQRENQRLRMELEGKHRIDLRMNQEDEEVFALVAANRQYHPMQAQENAHPIFDFDHAEIEPMDAEIEPVDTEFICTEEQGGRAEAGLGYLTRFGIFVLLESAVWLAHHFGWIDLIMAGGLTLFVFLFARTRLF